MTTRQTNRIRMVRRRIEKLLEMLPSHHYHNREHTSDVCKAAARLADAEGVTPREREMLKVAALFHDIGYIRRYDVNEPEGARIADEALHEFGFSAEDRLLVMNLILATSMPQSPKNKLEMIMCDADLAHLGSDKFMRRSNDLRREWETAKGKVYSDWEWTQLQLGFLEGHTYFTESARSILDETKKRNLHRLEKESDQESSPVM